MFRSTVESRAGRGLGLNRRICPNTKPERGPPVVDGGQTGPRLNFKAKVNGAAVLILTALPNFVVHLLSKCRFTANFDEVDDKVTEQSGCLEVKMRAAGSEGPMLGATTVPSHWKFYFEQGMFHGERVASAEKALKRWAIVALSLRDQ